MDALCPNLILKLLTSLTWPCVHRFLARSMYNQSRYMTWSPEQQDWPEGSSFLCWSRRSFFGPKSTTGLSHIQPKAEWSMGRLHRRDYLYTGILTTTCDIFLVFHISLLLSSFEKFPISSLKNVVTMFELGRKMLFHRNKVTVFVYY